MLLLQKALCHVHSVRHLFTTPDALQAFAFASAVASAAGGTAPFTSAVAQASAQVQPQRLEANRLPAR